MSKRIAIIGTGPSGMAAAQVLASDGYNVTMYEKHDRPGGILMYGIPQMKLNKNNVLKKAQILQDLGVEFILNTNVTKEDVANTISSEYDAVLLATGAEKARDISIDGRQLSNIFFAMEYLTDNTKHLLDGSPLKIDAKGKNVVIIGGGDTANDCVATALSQGAKSVRQLEISPKDQPRKKNSYDFDEDEIRLYQKTAVKFIDCDGEGCVAKVVTDQVDFVRDENGTKIEFNNLNGEMEADLVFVAIGFLGPLEEALDAFDVELDRSVHNKDTDVFTTNKENIFICGDARRGQSLIKWAIGEGKMAALAIERYLQ
ncbi:FAD-dependent oxidoreductase [Candidatus Xianfuyuplasma coldseepsis]|uniref:FAD-dependent oxidoreductase n=1 Tax=Candidatus Xianfuyuplasma coldseepsis TaxID=2782163 RepID=A0A7L7KPE1_9MOLU|nr:FAD-dependent oxidoreductase [Xianfuyuplasma coldseepsis]QMS84650.1 FAD-dependent oxidoreductase [Xianfuyuplasma coldseepsis]